MKKENSKFYIFALILVLLSNNLFANKPLPLPNYKTHNEFLNKRKDKEIYLGINTNINVIDNWCPIIEPDYTDNKRIRNHKIGLYLGKIIFEKNKQGNLAPKYIPSNIENLEQELEKINPLWLDELNKHFTAPAKIKDYGMGGRYATYTPNNFKVLCQNSKHNITLNKEQILSYFTELHTKNTQFIQAYIDEINKNKGIKAYINIESYYDKLAKEGIIPPNLLSKYNDGTYKQNNEADLIVLDYLKSNNEADFMILLNDELFYDYLVFSLQNYTILYYQGYIAETNNMLFNLAAYVDILDKDKREEALNFWYDSLPNDIKDEMYYCYLAYWLKTREGFFDMIADNYILTDEVGRIGYQFSTPNANKRGMLLFDRDKSIIFQPSPLGNYYFELSNNPDTYIEYFQGIYPSITNPPKGWTKEMMKKLDLKLE